MSKRIRVTVTANRVTFSNRSGGSFSMPLCREQADSLTDVRRESEPREQPKKRMTFREWAEKHQGR